MRYYTLPLLAVILSITGCLNQGGGGNNSKISSSTTSLLTFTPTPTSTPTEGDVATLKVEVTGLNSDEILIIESNEGEQLTIVEDGIYSFDYSYTIADEYSAEVNVQPTGQSCGFVGEDSGIFITEEVTLNIQCTQLSYSIGGTVSGLDGTVVLSNGDEDKTITTNGTYTFTTEIDNLEDYSVSISTMPTGQLCTLSHESGTIGASDVSNINLTCTTLSYTLGGTVSGLSGTVIIENGENGEELTLTSNGAFTFTQEIDHGDSYDVSVITHPIGKTCTISNSSGTINADDVTNLSISCFTSYLIKGTVSGLAASHSFVIKNNGADPQTIVQNGLYSFSVGLANNSLYTITVTTEPTGQTCTITDGNGDNNGTVSGANITDVDINCVHNDYDVGGTITGQLSSVVLQNNGGDDLTVLDSDTSFTFATPITYQSTYNVAVLTNPTGQTCSVTDGAGTMEGADLTSVIVNCGNNSYDVGGTVSGAAGMSGSLVLQNNGGNDKTISGNGAYTFSSKVTYQGDYEVTVKTNPTNKSCTVSNDSGTVSVAADVTNVDVTCVNSYTVGGTVSGLEAGGAIIIKNNGGNSTTLTANGAYSFSTRLLNAEDYDVDIITNPTGQTCVLSNDTGTIAGASVSNVDIACSDNSYSVGGTISGLSGSVVLQLDGANDETFNSNGNFTISANVDYADSYVVTVLTHPTGQECTITNGSGTMGSANVVNVAISCDTSSHSIGGTVGSSSGLTGTLILRKTVGAVVETATITSTGAYTFATPVDYGDSYTITVQSNPTGRSCTISNSSGTVNQVAGVDVTNVDVECYMDVDPLYSVAPDWNDYVNADTLTTACSGSETQVEKCIHGGDKKKVITVYTSCSNLSLTDNLGFFDWSCSVTSGKATFTSSLKSTAVLGDLIDASTPASPEWKENYVGLTYNAVAVGRSESAVWWNNIVTALPDNSATTVTGLGQAGRIYVLGVDRSSKGYNIEADKIALVIMSGYTLTADVSGNNCKMGDGGMTGADGQCLIASGSKKFLWIEGEFSGDGDFSENGFYFYSTKFSHFRSITASNFDMGLRFNSSDYNYLYNINSHTHYNGATSHGLYLYQSDGNLVSDFYSANCVGDGVQLNGSNSNRFYKVNSYNNGVNGLLLTDSDYNAFVFTIAEANTVTGITFNSTSNYNHLLATTVVNNIDSGLVISNNSDYSVVVNAVLVNNGVYGLSSESSSDYGLFGQIVSRDNGTKDVRLNSSSYNKFDGYLLTQNSATFCTVAGGSEAGLDNATCSADDASLGEVTIGTVSSLATSFQGKQGASLYASTLWTSLGHFYQNWGLDDAAAFPDSAHRQTCSAAQSCQKWDWRLDSSDDELLNVSGNISTGNGSFLAGSSCPSVIGGDRTLSYLTLTFLQNGVEKIDIDDAEGDEDGLCEASETCIYTPNFGAYQGLFSTLSSCSFSASGSMTGVTVYGATTNGE